MPTGKTCTLVWLIDEKLEDVEDFTGWDEAVRKGGEMRPTFVMRPQVVPASKVRGTWLPP
jgi:hypothetical protein